MAWQAGWVLRGPGRRPAALVGVALVAAVVAVYHRVGGFAFVFDDLGFLHANPAVSEGLSAEGLRWALTSFATGNWHPLTWLSHMLDVQLFGLRPGPHHLVNLVFHATNTLLLFIVLRRLTGALWPGAFVAALFAVHPVHVESVAWVAERKDLLAGLFWMLAVRAHARHAAAPGVRRYALVALLFALGLMAKPMVVTLPVVLLLLDWWPLGRVPRGGGARRAWGALVVEKLPLLALAAAVGFVTARAQESVGAIAPGAVYTPALRIANAVVAPAIYLGKVAWPSGLAAYYPFPLGGRPAWQVGGGLLLLAGISAAAIGARRRCPALAVGWLWFLVGLAPVLGFIQVGGQARADRYLYLPLIGVGLAAAWCAPPLLRRARVTGVTLAAAALVALAVLAVAAERQSETWRTPLSLFGRMLEVTSDNAVAHQAYALELVRLGRSHEALEHFRAAIAIAGGSAELRVQFARALHDAGRVDEAIGQLRVVVRLRPEDADAQYRLGLLLGQAGQYGESLPALREAARLRPSEPSGWDALGVTCANLGLRSEAESAFLEVLRLEPGNGNARRNLENLRSLR